VEFLKPGETPREFPPQEQRPAAWVPRPEDYLRPPMTPPVAPGGTRGVLHRVAGLLLALSGLVAMAWTVAAAVEFLTPAEYANLTEDVTPILWATSQVCALLGIWAQAVAILAGAMAFSRLHWRFAVTCAIIATVLIGGTAVAFGNPYYGGAAVLGLIGVALLTRGRQEFVS
jgi:hypothetical protein